MFLIGAGTGAPSSPIAITSGAGFSQQCGRSQGAALGGQPLVHCPLCPARQQRGHDGPMGACQVTHTTFPLRTSSHEQPRSYQLRGNGVRCPIRGGGGGGHEEGVVGEAAVWSRRRGDEGRTQPRVLLHDLVLLLTPGLRLHGACRLHDAVGLWRREVKRERREGGRRGGGAGQGKCNGRFNNPNKGTTRHATLTSGSP